jgi:hypothetical protein
LHFMPKALAIAVKEIEKWHEKPSGEREWRNGNALDVRKYLKLEEATFGIWNAFIRIEEYENALYVGKL